MNEPPRNRLHFEPLLPPAAPGAPNMGARNDRRMGAAGQFEGMWARIIRSGKPIGIVIAALGVLAGSVMGVRAFAPISPPDSFTDPLDDVLGFALLDADFSRLPLEKRIELAKEIAARLRSLSAQESALMAAFAAGIAGKARERLQDNLATLMVDLFDSYAQRYARIPPDQKERFIQESLLEMIALQQELDPTAEPATESPQESLDEIKSGSTRRAERRAAGGGATSITRSRAEDSLTRIEQDVNTRTSPAERGRTVRFMRDTVRYLRSQDIDTGKPKRP